MDVDHSVYPDLDVPPAALLEPGERADYVHRICSAWDYGLVPELSTFGMLRDWQEIFDRYPLSHSPAYHAFRAWFGWPPVARGTLLESTAEQLDRREQREDPCASAI